MPKKTGSKTTGGKKPKPSPKLPPSELPKPPKRGFPC